MKNLILIGLPGSGKSTLGRLLAQHLQLQFIDSDTEIEKQAGCSIPDIFAKEGEEGFRNAETAALKALSIGSGMVLATGGGAILRAENREILRQMGLVVFIDRPPEQICSDLEIAHRPLLRNGPQALQQLALQRRELYLACAHYVLTNMQDTTLALTRLLQAWHNFTDSGYAVIGDPIAHSLSPAIHGAAFKQQGLCLPYEILHVPRGTLPSFLSGVRVSSLRGFNVTLPHKQDILPLLDEVHPEAAMCGAVNTVVHEDGRLHGYNTDMGGLHLALQQTGHGFKGRHVVILGAGGAARAAALKAGLEKAASVHIAARSAAKAQALAEHVAQCSQVPTSYGTWQPKNFQQACSACELLINATPLGMHGFGQQFEDLYFVQALPASSFVCDLIYTPAETLLLQTARMRGLGTLNGLGMLIYQALLAQELYLKKELNKPALFKHIKNTLFSAEGNDTL